MPNLINEETARAVKEALQAMQAPVEIAFFGNKTGCKYCPETRQLLQEVADLSDRLILSVYDLDEDDALAGQYHIDKVPCITLLRLEDGQPVDYGVRFAGIPAGHEFSSLVHVILLVSGGDSGLATSTREFLDGLKSPLTLQVFTTPT